MINFERGDVVLVIGLGRSGLACVEVLRERGLVVYATDEKPRDDLGEPVAEIERHGARFVEPAQLPAIVKALNAAVLSPGVPLTSAVVRCVQDANVPVFGEIEVAYRLSAAPMIAVTGTKGKSTTTALIGHLLRACGKNVRVGGNIGKPLIREIDGLTADDWVVAEVSSFQLETIRAFRPRVAVLLNIAPDHLDRYFSMDEYAEAKFRIFANQGPHDAFVGNLDDARLGALHWEKSELRMQSRQLWYTLGKHHEKAALYLRGEMLTYAPIAGDPRPISLLQRDEIRLTGEHNVQNVMAALLAALAVGCDPALLREAVKTFEPMAHRLQRIAEIDGVLYVDDSKATNPGAVEAALRAFDRPIVLIAGGRSKATAFAQMGKTIARYAKAVVLIGESADEIAATIFKTPVQRAASMREAVAKAREAAQPGDVVLLSPGCASFDMFASAEDRGEQFATAVHALKEPAGA